MGFSDFFGFNSDDDSRTDRRSRHPHDQADYCDYDDLCRVNHNKRDTEFDRD